jgi:hypothetical protein
MMETTFLNVTITVTAGTPKEAYERLCSALGNLECDWNTDTFTTDESPDDSRSTEELFP